MTKRPPLMLLHGVTNSARIWDGVAALIRDDYDLIVPTYTGHRGGPEKPSGLTVTMLVDEVEATLDGLGHGAVHIAGNSLGGWIALELARRGRALSVCALSPAGCWTPGAKDETHATTAIRWTRRIARASAPVAPHALRNSTVRRLALRVVALHGDRVTAQEAFEIARDLIECTAAPDLLGTSESLTGIDPLPCPVTLAWATEDRIFPPAVNGTSAQRLFPGATYLELDDVGHVPMIDNPALCAEVIRRTIGQASNPVGDNPS